MEQQYVVQRAEERIATKVAALLVGGHGRFGVETGLTDNVSSRGVRVITASRWSLDETILVALPGFRFTSAARVAYSEPLGDGRFGTGLEFAGPSEHLEITALATALALQRL